MSQLSLFDPPRAPIMAWANNVFMELVPLTDACCCGVRFDATGLSAIPNQWDRDAWHIQDDHHFSRTNRVWFTRLEALLYAADPALWSHLESETDRACSSITHGVTYADHDSEAEEIGTDRLAEEARRDSRGLQPEPGRSRRAHQLPAGNVAQLGTVATRAKSDDSATAGTHVSKRLQKKILTTPLTHSRSEAIFPISTSMTHHQNDNQDATLPRDDHPGWDSLLDAVLEDDVKANWIKVSEQAPDAETTVLIACADADEPVWLGYFDGDEWRTVEGMPVNATHWAMLPEAPEVKS